MQRLPIIICVNAKCMCALVGKWSNFKDAHMYYHLKLVFPLVSVQPLSSLHQFLSHKCNLDTSSNTHFHTPTRQLTKYTWKHFINSVEPVHTHYTHTNTSYIVCDLRAGQHATACEWICHGNQSRHMTSKSAVLSVKNKLDRYIISSV